MRRFSLPAPPALLAFASWLAACDPRPLSEGEQLARIHCASCHRFPEPEQLDRMTWQESVLPKMAPRLGVTAAGGFSEAVRNPYMTVLRDPVAEEEWRKIVEYYVSRAPRALSRQSLPAKPAVDPQLFESAPFTRRMPADASITLLELDEERQRVFVGEGNTSGLLVFDRSGRLTAAVQLASPAADILVRKDHVLVLETGLLEPNDEARGRLVRYDVDSSGALRLGAVLIDSLIRPVYFDRFELSDNGRVRETFIICEYGNNRGRLALYRDSGTRYARQVVDSSPGSIRFELRDMTGDGRPDLVALFTLGDERIVLFENDGKRGFVLTPRVLARFPPSYGSTHFLMHDFNSDGRPDILYVNGGSFGSSSVLKPYHGIRVLENDGGNTFTERYFFPIHGAARAEAADFDGDGDLDILTASSFPASAGDRERGIMYFENMGGDSYNFAPYAFSSAAANQWAVVATGDLDEDGALDAIVGAMPLAGGVPSERAAVGPVVALLNTLPSQSGRRTP